MICELDIGDDMLAAAREIAGARGASLDRTVSDLVRSAVHPRRGGVVTNELVRRLLDEEYEELAARSRRSLVRTTLDVDEDVVRAVEKLATARKVDAGRIVTESLWDALWAARLLDAPEGANPVARPEGPST